MSPASFIELHKAQQKIMRAIEPLSNEDARAVIARVLAVLTVDPEARS
jgi:hypothetical protein